MISAILGVFAACGLAVLFSTARRQQTAAMLERSKLLDGMRHLLVRPSLRIGPDGFPAIAGYLPDGRRATAILIIDTLVTRRLPQLWLAVTVQNVIPEPHPSVGVLARPTNAEFYSQVHDLPDRLEPPTGFSHFALIRGEDMRPENWARVAPVLRQAFGDPKLKEVAAIRGSVRIVRQAAEGERGAHLLLRQIRFSDGIDPDLLGRAVAEADMLANALCPTAAASRLSA